MNHEYAKAATIGGALSGYSLASAQTQAYVPDATVLERIINRLDELGAVASVQRDQAYRLAGRLAGELPPSPKNASVAPVRSGMLGQIEDKLDLIHSAMRDGDDALSRLRDAI